MTPLKEVLQSLPKVFTSFASGFFSGRKFGSPRDEQQSATDESCTYELLKHRMMRLNHKPRWSIDPTQAIQAPLIRFPGKEMLVVSEEGELQPVTDTAVQMDPHQYTASTTMRSAAGDTFDVNLVDICINDQGDGVYRGHRIPKTTVQELQRQTKQIIRDKLFSGTNGQMTSITSARKALDMPYPNPTLKRLHYPSDTQHFLYMARMRAASLQLEEACGQPMNQPSP